MAAARRVRSKTTVALKRKGGQLRLVPIGPPPPKDEFLATLRKLVPNAFEARPIYSPANAEVEQLRSTASAVEDAIRDRTLLLDALAHKANEPRPRNRRKRRNASVFAKVVDYLRKHSKAIGLPNEALAASAGVHRSSIDRIPELKEMIQAQREAARKGSARDCDTERDTEDDWKAT